MSNIWILLKAQLINFFPINEIRDSRNKKQSSMAIASFGIITLSLFCFVYNIITAKTLVHVGQQKFFNIIFDSILFEWHFIWQSRYGNSPILTC